MIFPRHSTGLMICDRSTGLTISNLASSKIMNSFEWHENLRALVEPVTRGDPEALLR